MMSRPASRKLVVGTFVFALASMGAALCVRPAYHYVFESYVKCQKGGIWITWFDWVVAPPFAIVGALPLVMAWSTVRVLTGKTVRVSEMVAIFVVAALSMLADCVVVLAMCFRVLGADRGLVCSGLPASQGLRAPHRRQWTRVASHREIVVRPRSAA
jgi:hypothetical protein